LGPATKKEEGFNHFDLWHFICVIYFLFYFILFIIMLHAYIVEIY